MAQPDSKQLTILKRLTVLIEGVSILGGDDYDLTGHVFRGQAKFGADEVLPFVSILESLRPDNRPLEAGDEKLLRIEHWELLVQGWVTTSRDAPTDALYQLKAAVEKRVARIVAKDAVGNPAFPGDYRLGGLVSGLRIGPGVVRAATPQVGGAEAFYLPLLFSYAINLADPYALS